MALIKGKFIDPALRIQQNQDPAVGNDITRKSYVDTKSEGDAAAAQSAAQSYADGKVEDTIVNGVTAKAPSQNAVFDALALKQNSLGTGTTAQYLRGDLTWQEVITSSPVAQIKYVSKNGVDASADGSEEKPYLTIAAAMASITDASPSKRYVIRIAAGSYTEASVAIKSNVFLVGDSKESVRITGAVSMGAWTQDNSGSDDRSGFSMVTLLSAVDLNWNTAKSRAGKIYMNEVVFASTLSMYGYDNGIAQAQLNACLIFGNLTISGINVGVFTNNIAYADITLNQHPSLASILAATGGSCSGTLRFNTTVNNFNRRSSGFLKGFYSENLIIDGPSSYADADLVSQGKSSTQRLNGGTLVALSPRISHDIETQMLKPLTTNSHNLGDWGKQYFFNFAYVQGSSGTDLYILSTMDAYDPAGDSSGKSIYITPDGYGLKPNVSGGNVEIETAAVSGTGVRGKVQIKARELDLTSSKITNLANGTASNDAVNKSQLDSAQSAAQSYADGKVEDAIVDGVTSKAPSQNAVFDALSLKLNLSGGTLSGALAMGANKITGLANGVDPQDAVTKAQLDAAVQAADQAPYKQSKVLDATDISNGYVDLARVVMPSSMMLSVSGTVQYEGEDYSLSTVGGVTRVTFLGDLTPDGDGAALVVGDKVHFHYWAPVPV